MGRIGSHVKATVRGSARAVYRVARRTVVSGPSSGYACLSTYVSNAAVRLANATASETSRACPCCGWEGARFRTIDCGLFTVPNAECPGCFGHERHRMMHLFLQRRPPAFTQGAGSVLHFAPERHIREFLDRNPAITSISTDYDPSQVTRAEGPWFIADIHHLPLASNSLIGIFCLHVLEHVNDDRRALDELCRVLKPGQEAIVMVPFMMGQRETIEYDAPDPDQFDHVRGYSPLDFKDRLAAFEFEEIMPGDIMSPEEIVRFDVPDSQAIYVCRKAMVASAPEEAAESAHSAG